MSELPENLRTDSEIGWAQTVLRISSERNALKAENERLREALRAMLDLTNVNTADAFAKARAALELDSTTLDSRNEPKQFWGILQELSAAIEHLGEFDSSGKTMFELKTPEAEEAWERLNEAQASAKSVLVAVSASK